MKKHVTRLALIAGRHFLVRPRTVRDGAFEQRSVTKHVTDPGFEPGERFVHELALA